MSISSSVTSTYFMRMPKRTSLLSNQKSGLYYYCFIVGIISKCFSAILKQFNL
ncbi:hypothetical protein BDF14DRAFT_1796586 [Spinellus fusiger]|nr:hypothetical protein BDF14DRAFT_1796586 [Spinellus fusiger]